MQRLKQILGYTLIVIIMSSFSKCSQVKLEENAPLNLGDVYCQKWVSGVKGGGAGLILVIPTEDDTVALNQVYFRGKVADLEKKPSSYVGRFISDVNDPIRLTVKGEANTDGTNSKIKVEDIPFELADNQCAVSYTNSEGKIKFFKIDNISQKASNNYFGAPKGGSTIKIDNIKK